MNLLKAIAAASHRGVSSPTDPLWANVIFLGKFYGANGSTTFPEYTGKTISAVAGAALSTGNTLYGPSSLYLDGVGDYATVPAGSMWDFGSATDFCVEGWVWLDSTDPAGAMYCLQDRTHLVNFFSGVVRTGNGVINTNSSGYTGFTDKWTHYAHVRESGIHRLYFDGVLRSTSAFSTAVFGSSASTLLLGRDPSAGESKAWIDSVRVTSGNPRYTSDFTPGDFPTS